MAIVRSRISRQAMRIASSSTRAFAIALLLGASLATLSACGNGAAATPAACDPASDCVDPADGDTEATAPADDAPSVEAETEAETAPVPTCPPARPPIGMPCVGPIECKYTATAGDSTARCVGGHWSLDVPPCTGGPAATPRIGEACTNEGAHCAWPNNCGTDDVGDCVGGVWQLQRAICPRACPFAPPAGGCAVVGVACAWPNDCGGLDGAVCTDMSWLAPGSAGWIVSRSCPCPVKPSPGTGCAAESYPSCSYPDPCGHFNTLLCGNGHWWWDNKASCNCPAQPPTDGLGCDPALEGWCSYKPTPYCEENWDCGADHKWRLPKPRTCQPPPPPGCPPDGFGCGPEQQGMVCGYPQRCGRIRWQSCAGGVESPSCDHACPDDKPVTGTPCFAPATSICQYVTDVAGQCESDCVCITDTKTWACAPPTCTPQTASK
jgi:hypothetical protein